MKTLLTLTLTATALLAQGLDPAKLKELPTDTWPTFNGDYSGRRFSPLKQVNAANVGSLTLAWTYRINMGPNGPGGVSVKATPLEVNGVLYFSVPDHAWAVDARTGRQLWHYEWKSKGGIHIGSRGLGMYRDWLYMETPDNYLICLDSKTGKERWHVEIGDVRLEYFSTPAPVVIGNHIIVGTGGDSLDVPGYLEARDPETGATQWHWNTTPRAGEKNADTWPTKDAMEHGGGMTWMPGTYDPELNLYYLGTGNPNPVFAGQGRKGDNLYTCSIVAINPDTGKMAWYFQASPHDTHDWDAVQTPVVFDGAIDGKPRKLVAQASRNGYFFVLDRVTGKKVVSAPYIPLNWSKGEDQRGQPIPNPDKDPKTDGILSMPSASGGTNWAAPSFSPATGLFYVSATENYSLLFMTDDEAKPEGFAGKENNLWSKAMLKAIDYKTGKVKWTHEYPGLGGGNFGILTTAGNLLFTGDPYNNFIAFNPLTGAILWHSRLGGPVANGPMSYELDGKQYVVVGGGDTVYAFALNK
jgi:acido-empty-quinoprotein group A